MARATKKRKASGGRAVASKKEEQLKAFTPADHPATVEDRKKWKGWCEIESDPAFFNHILSEWGIRGARIREVWSLEPEALGLLPEPVYGIVFLFRYHDEDAVVDDSASDEADNVWFATQQVSNSCASVALMNMIMNVPGLDLGKNMSRWKESTKDMTHSQRGRALKEFTFVRQVHNTWTRKIDMMKHDWFLKLNREEKKKQAKKPPARKNPSRNPPRKAQTKSPQATTTTTTTAGTETEAAFHFIAYMPIGGSLWKLDGMNERPAKVDYFTGGGRGGTEEGWLGAVADVIQARMQQFEGEGIEFSCMAFAKDPICIARERMTEAIVALRAVERALDDADKDWRASCDDAQPPSRGKKVQFAIDRDNQPLGNGAAAENGETAGGISSIDPADREYLEFDITPVDLHTTQVPKEIAEAIAQAKIPNEPSSNGDLPATSPPNGTDLAIQDASSSTEAPGPNDTTSVPDGHATASASKQTLLSLRSRLLSTLASHRGAYRDETMLQDKEAEKAARRKIDYVPLVEKWMRWLAEKDHEDEDGNLTGKSVLEVLAERHKR